MRPLLFPKKGRDRAATSTLHWLHAELSGWVASAGQLFQNIDFIGRELVWRVETVRTQDLCKREPSGSGFAVDFVSAGVVPAATPSSRHARLRMPREEGVACRRAAEPSAEESAQDATCAKTHTVEFQQNVKWISKERWEKCTRWREGEKIGSSVSVCDRNPVCNQLLVQKASKANPCKAVFANRVFQFNQFDIVPKAFWKLVKLLGDAEKSKCSLFVFLMPTVCPQLLLHTNKSARKQTSCAGSSEFGKRLTSGSSAQCVCVCVDSLCYRLTVWHNFYRIIPSAPTLAAPPFSWQLVQLEERLNWWNFTARVFMCITAQLKLARQLKSDCWVMQGNTIKSVCFVFLTRFSFSFTFIFSKTRQIHL